MKVFGGLIIFSLHLFYPDRLSAQSAGNWVTDSIRTSAHCELCKKDIEKALRHYKGVKKSEVDLDRGVVFVTYSRRQVQPDSLRVFLSRLGYDADSVPARNKIMQRRKDNCFKRID